MRARRSVTVCAVAILLSVMLPVTVQATEETRIQKWHKVDTELMTM